MRDYGLRKALERSYSGRMWVSGQRDVVMDGATRTMSEETYSEVPCYLDRSRVSAVSSDGVKSSPSHHWKVMCAPEITLKAGDRVRIIQDGMDYTFKFGGHPYKYPTHQEIVFVQGDCV